LTISPRPASVDIIVSSVARDYLLTLPMVRSFVKKRAGQPLFMIDIAVPRNIDPEVNGLHGVFLYNIDDLKSIADENLKNRLSEVEIARGLIESDPTNSISGTKGFLVCRRSYHPGEIRRDTRGELKCTASAAQKPSRRGFRRVEDLTIRSRPRRCTTRSAAEGYHPRESHREKIRSGKERN
jgi:hypothetical protein